MGNDEDYLAELKKCDGMSGTSRDRCVAEVKDRFGRM